LKSLQHCYKTYNCYIIETYGYTKDPELEDYILVMKYASEGDLHKYLQKNFTGITWNKGKLDILLRISRGYLYLKFIIFLNLGGLLIFLYF
jgi:hypothetical protein